MKHYKFITSFGEYDVFANTFRQAFIALDDLVPNIKIDDIEDLTIN